MEGFTGDGEAGRPGDLTRGEGSGAGEHREEERVPPRAGGAVQVVPGVAPTQRGEGRRGRGPVWDPAAVHPRADETQRDGGG